MLEAQPPTLVRAGRSHVVGRGGFGKLLPKARKFFRFVRIYGLPRALFKVLGRSRTKIRLWSFPRARDVAVIGCGQYSFATIGFFLWRNFGNRFSKCFDIDASVSSSFASFYGASPVSDVNEILSDGNVKYVYIASNHASHSSYAVSALASGKTVYVEKPIAVSFEQLAALRTASALFPGKLFVGFNRPHSSAVTFIRNYFPREAGPITLSCFVSGHFLPAEHWYRRPEEGTRVCGNMAHWIDLAVHILSWNGLPDDWHVSAVWSDEKVRDDNVAVTLTSARGDLISILMSSRAEPFDGVTETINLQAGSIFARIDDFRRIELWDDFRHEDKRIWPKDVGHKEAICLPFLGTPRCWSEVEDSALLTLHVAEMIRGGVSDSKFSFPAARARLQLS